MDSLTNTIGVYIRDILRADATLLTLLGLTSANSKNHIFLTRPVKQFEGFDNPRIVIMPAPSDADELANTGIYQGQENFLISIWTNDSPYTTSLNVLDRIATLFNKTLYTFTSGTSNYNYGTFRCFNKVSLPDPDKTNTIQGTMNIVLNIGGNF